MQRKSERERGGKARTGAGMVDRTGRGPGEGKGAIKVREPEGEKEGYGGNSERGKSEKRV